MLKMLSILLLLNIFLVSCSLPVKQESVVNGKKIDLIFAKNGGAYFLVSLNGRRYLAQFDTGFAGSLGITPKMAQELRLPCNKDNVAIQRMWGKSSDTLKTCNISELQLSPNLRISNVTAWKVDGLEVMMLGLGILTNYNLLVDVSQSNVTFYPPGTDISQVYNGKISSLDFDLQHLMWVLCQEKDLGEFVLMIDSGMIFKDKKNGYYYHTLSVNSPQISSLLSPQEILQARQLLTSSPGAVSKTGVEPVFMSTSNLTVGGLPLGFHVFVAAPLHESFHEGALGLGFFAERKVFVDFVKEKIYILNQ